MKNALLLALTFSITMVVGLGLHSDPDDDVTLIKHKLYKCSSLDGNTVIIEGERKRYIGECSFGGYFVQGPAVKM